MKWIHKKAPNVQELDDYVTGVMSNFLNEAFVSGKLNEPLLGSFIGQLKEYADYHEMRLWKRERRANAVGIHVAARISEEERRQFASRARGVIVRHAD